MGMLDGEATSLALCWQLERADGAGIALTSHDRAFASEGSRLDPTPGMTPAAVTRSLGLEPHSSDAGGALSSAALTEQDLTLGRWDGAVARLWVADWTDDDASIVQLIAGELGAVNISGNQFSAELKGAAARLRNPVCPATSPECRAELGDSRCRVDLAGRTRRARVLACEGRTLTVDAAFGDEFVLGRLRFLDGENCGLSNIILSATENQIELREPPKGLVEVGNRVAVREGCDKRLATCATRFANAVNFRGEPHLPGNDLLTRYPGA